MKLTNLNFTIFVVICLFLIVLIGFIISKVNNLEGAKAKLIRRVVLIIAFLFLIFANWYKSHGIG